eukprot:g15930.t1
MGSGNSTPAKVEPTNPVVRQLFLAAESDVEKKEIQKAIVSYQKAQSITTDDKVKEYIHYRLSLLASKDDGVVRPAETTNKQKIQKSQEVTAKFEHLLEEFKEIVKFPTKYTDAANVFEVIINIDCRQVKSVGTYFNSLMSDIVCDDTFQDIDMDQTYNIKENIMILLKDLAFVNFQNNLSIGLKMSSEKHAEMVDATRAHIKWMLKSETKGVLSFTSLYFVTDYLLDILKLMSTTDSLSDKMNLSNTAMDVLSECLSLNISGACEVLSKNLCAGILKVAKENIQGSFSKKTLSKLIQYKALTKTIDQLLTSESGTDEQLEAYEIFFQELDYAYSHRLNWKVYIQLLNDLYDIFKATPKENISMRLKLIQGDASKKHK